jgi:GGDEF domain-containing protein
MRAFYAVSAKPNYILTSLQHVEEQAIVNVASECLGFLVSYENDEQAEHLLNAIRQHDNPNVYLRAIVLLHNSELKPNYIRERFDCVFTEDEFTEVQLADLQSKFGKLNSWIAKIPNNDNTLSDASLRFRALRLMASRNARCTPNATIYDKRGFEYSLLRPLFSESDGSVEKVLAFLQSQQLVKDEFVKKAHFCPHCDSAFLNFKETCPDCSSDNLERDELIHHFKCGYTDVINKFIHNNRLKCPKCEDDLKHIGVDYDKPSTVSTCLGCKRTFQDPEVKADCFACHRSSSSDDLTLRTMSAFSVSAIGANAARFGLDALFTSILQSDLKLYSSAEIKQFVIVEKARIERYKKSETSLAVIHFANLEALFDTLGRKTEQVFKEISAVFKSIFRESDLITAKNESLYAVIMTETSTQNAKLAIERLDDAIKGLFEGSLDFTLQVNTEITNIIEVDDLDVVIDEFISAES